MGLPETSRVTSQLCLLLSPGPYQPLTPLISSPVTPWTILMTLSPTSPAANQQPADNLRTILMTLTHLHHTADNQPQGKHRIILKILRALPLLPPVLHGSP